MLLHLGDDEYVDSDRLVLLITRRAAEDSKFLVPDTRDGHEARGLAIFEDQSQTSFRIDTKTLRLRDRVVLQDRTKGNQDE